MFSAAGAKRGFWRIARPRDVRHLEEQIRRLSPRGPKSWYYPIDFGYGVWVRPELRDDPYAGDENWRFIERHLGDLVGRRILDIGCNAGLYVIRMAEAGAAEAVGMDLDVRQAEFLRDWVSRRNAQDLSAARFVVGDARTFDLSTLGRFDLVCLFCVAYHLGDDIEQVMSRIARITDAVVMQGNLPRLAGEKYRHRRHQHLAGVEGMSNLLRRHGYSALHVVAPEDHPKPLVVGRRA